MESKKERIHELLNRAIAEYEGENYLVPMPGYLAKQFVAYCSMREDILLTLKYIGLLRKNPIEPVKSSLTYAMISLYGKCYTEASHKYPNLDPKSVFKNRADLRIVHDDLMKQRHQFIAHRGDTDSEVAISFMAIPKVGDGESQLRFSQLKLRAFSTVVLNQIEELIKFILAELEAKIQISGQKAYDKFFASFTPEEILLLVMNGAKDIK